MYVRAYFPPCPYQINTYAHIPSEYTHIYIYIHTDILHIYKIDIKYVLYVHGYRQILYERIIIAQQTHTHTHTHLYTFSLYEINDK